MNSKKSPVVIDPVKCIGCGLCAKDCPTQCIKIDRKKAFLRDNAFCLACGHCFSICPVEAVSMPDYGIPCDEAVCGMENVDSGTLLKGMKSRRTIRCFRDERIEPEVLEKILEAGRYCPTAKNRQSVSFIVLDKKLEEAERLAVSAARRLQRIASPFVPSVKTQMIDDHFFFKNAPAVILVSTSSSMDAGLASSYMELMAESLGLGVMYSGYFMTAAKVIRKLNKLLNIRKGHKLVACMILGYPNVNYKRIPPRKKANVQYL